MQGGSFLVTGGTGSFGKAFIQYAIDHLSPRRLVIYSRDEMKQWDLQQKFSHPALRWFVGDVRDLPRLELAMRDIEYVIHAAALKIIPTAEYNPTESVATNITGTQNVCAAALRSGVLKVVALSTDKAANPCTLYGSTKLCAEKILTAYNALSGRQGIAFNAVRYGNIAFSRGSVIPHFQNQKKLGIPLTITDLAMSRFMYSLDKAVLLVLESLKSEGEGEILVPRMPSFRISDLAEVIDPAGIREIIGVRGTEKLHEDIITSYEPRIRRGDNYVILPSGADLPSGAQIGENLSSGTNDWWLSQDDLREILDAQAKNA
jgi:UDP-N-acetylglucosamine 4,6-dehydratase